MAVILVRFDFELEPEMREYGEQVGLHLEGYQVASVELQD